MSSTPLPYGRGSTLAIAERSKEVGKRKIATVLRPCLPESLPEEPYA